MDQKDRLNALEVALNNELKERAFYLKHAQRTKNPIGKAMFRQIGNEELDHYERLKQLHQKWGKNENSFLQTFRRDFRPGGDGTGPERTRPGQRGPGSRREKNPRLSALSPEGEGRSFVFFRGPGPGRRNPEVERLGPGSGHG